MILLQLIHLFAIIAAVFLGFFVLLNNQQRAVNIFFFSLSMIMTGWLIALATAFYTTNLHAAALAIRVASALGAIAPFAFSMMRRSITQPTVRWTKICALARMEALAPIATLVLVATPFYLKGAVASQIEPISTLPEPVYGHGVLLYALYFAFYFVYLAISFSRDIRASMGIQRTEIQFLLLGSLSGIFIGVLFSVIAPLITETSQSVQFAPISALFLEGIIAYGIATRRIMAVDDVLRRITAYALLALYLSALYVGVWWVFSRVLTPLAWGVFLSHLLGTLAVAFSMAPAHGRLQQVANKLFIRVQAADLTETLQKANRIINSMATRTEMLKQFAELVSKSIGADRVLILLDEGESFVQAHPYLPRSERAQFANNNPLSSILVATGSPIAADTIHRQRAQGNELEAGRLLASLKASLAIGIYAKDGLKGIVLLGPRLSGRIYGLTEQRALQVLCNQLAIGLDNADLYTQVRDSAIYNDILLDNLVNGVIAANKKGNVSVCNREALQILRCKHDDVLHHPIGALPSALAQALRNTFETGHGLRNVEIRIVTGSGEELPVRFSTARFTSHTGERLGALLLLEDLTTLKKLEGQVRRTDRLASIGTLSAGMAHEIKNPLVTLKTFTQLLPERYNDEDFRDTFSALVGQEVKRIDSIVNQLLRFARPAKASLHPLHTNEVIDNTLRLVQQQLRQKQVHLERSSNATTDLILGDSDMLAQAFLNFILNALDSMESGGTLTIHTECVDMETNQITLDGKLATEPNIRISISDTGRGINQEDIAHIFDPFFTTKSSGTGLGLSVSHGIISEHHGIIDVESAPDQGTTFYLLFPLATEEVRQVTT